MPVPRVATKTLRENGAAQLTCCATLPEYWGRSFSEREQGVGRYMGAVAAMQCVASAGRKE